MVRLVFRPYTQVGRPICTSGPLRTSTRVSSGFALPRHSSPSFGSYRARSCSTSPTERARRAGGAPAGDRVAGGGIPPRPGTSPVLHFHCATGFRSSPWTRARVRLLGPCFKTGRVGHRHRRRPLALLPLFSPFDGREDVDLPRRGGAALSGRTENSPPRSTAAPRAGGPVPLPRGPRFPRRNPGTLPEERDTGGSEWRSGSEGGRGGDRLPRPRATACIGPRGGCNAGRT
ncbi:hypothetical protein GDO81_024402 [Engystomops pustulosus]|uniref:Uncharacterized protein n=1 Tax=Engystomops pustulosus TaxID=76066 RepID=A0AAV6YN53_ENGPU|nr:hypothetical protein GDO81_024402 [Engystomops pustulosus]